MKGVVRDGSGSAHRGQADRSDEAVLGGLLAEHDLDEPWSDDASMARFDLVTMGRRETLDSDNMPVRVDTRRPFRWPFTTGFTMLLTVLAVGLIIWIVL